MDVTTLEKANALNQKIQDYTEVLRSLYWLHPYDESKKFSTNPRLVIDFDDSGERRQLLIPESLNKILLEYISTEFQKDRAAAVKEFNEL